MLLMLLMMMKETIQIRVLAVMTFVQMNHTAEQKISVPYLPLLRSSQLLCWPLCLASAGPCGQWTQVKIV